MATRTTPGRISPGEIFCSYPRANAILSAMAATLAIWAISVYVGQVDPALNNGAQEVGPIDVVLATLVAGLAGWGLLAFLERRTDRAWPIWRTIAIAVLILSMLGPLGADEAAKIVLSVMHAMAAAILIKSFASTVRRR